MDGFTHSMVGLAAAKAGLEKLSPGTTLLCLLAANAPDSDLVVLLFEGRWPFLQHHRGITHAIIGTLVLAILLALIFYFGDWLISYFRKRKPTAKLAGLLVASVLVTFTHPFLDWTNNYGVRWLLPWSAQWSYGDFAFVVDPYLWVTLGGAVFVATSKSKKQLAVWIFFGLVACGLVLFGPVTRFQMGNAMVVRGIWVLLVATFIVIYKLDGWKRWGAKIPQAALVIVALYLGGLFLTHRVALRQATVEAGIIASEYRENLGRIAAMPNVANPLKWSSVFETERATYRFELFLNGSKRSNLVRYEKIEASESPALERALGDWRTEILLGFARFPVVRVVGEDCLSQTLVQFADLRYTEPGQQRGSFSLDVPVECPTRISELVK